MSNANPRAGWLLEAYMTYVSDEGIDIDRFVECGGGLLRREASAGLVCGLTDLRQKIIFLRGNHPRLARQLEFLANFFESDTTHVPENMRNETAFALLYAVTDMDLVPDDTPGIGYLDDTAVTEVVLCRHAEVFERHCTEHGIEWAVLKPETAN